MIKKEIYASLEVADHEVRLIVGEFYETRFNILRVERALISGVEQKRIVDEQNVVNGIIKAAKQAENALGYRIERILLAIPSTRVTRHNKRVNVIPEASSKRIRLSDIQKGVNEAIRFKPDRRLELVNIGCIKYITNGITSRKMPIDEVSELLIVDVDLLYADKENVYAYARCVEKAGLDILDICLDSYAIAQEAAIFEQTVDKYVILVDIARTSTTLSLFTHGKLASCEVVKEGYEKWLQQMQDVYHLSTNVSFRLAQNTCTFDEENASESVIYIWSENGQQKQITEKESCHIIGPYVKQWIAVINEICTPIVKNGNIRYLLSGEGCEIQSLQQLLDEFNAPAQIYVPQTIGARECSLVTCLGLFYSWKELMAIRKDERISCTISEVEAAIDTAHKLHDTEDNGDEGGFTKKLKNILLNDK